MENENIYQRLQEMFGTKVDDQLSILEDQIDIDLQMEYFEYSKQNCSQRSVDEIMRSKDRIFSSGTPVDDKKKLFVELASLDSVEAYRTIEKYLEKPETDFMRDWAVMAFQESRMTLESRMLDQNKIFISTGLGGRENKLRYFVVMFCNEGERFNHFRAETLSKEIRFSLTDEDAELESIDFYDSYAMLTVLIPIDVSIRDMFLNTIAECNHFGDFLRSNFIVTNVKKLSCKEIELFLQSQAQ